MFSFALGALRVLAIIALSLFPALAETESEFKAIEGEWVSTTGQQQGETIVFKKVTFGYDAWISWWGRTSIVNAEGEYGAHVKISGSKIGSEITCFYVVVPIGSGTVISYEMSWRKKHGDSSSCPDTAIFKKSINEAREEFDRYIAAGDKAISDKDYATAIAAYTNATHLNRMSVEAFNKLGNAYLFKEEVALSILNYSNAIAISGGDPDYYLNRCNAYLEDGNAKDAALDGDRVIDADSEDQRGYRCRGKAYAELHEYDDAITDLEMALLYDDNDDDIIADQILVKEWKDKIHKFNLRFCNETTDAVHVASAGMLDPDSDKITVKGWYRISPKSCKDAGVYLNSSGAYYTVSEWWPQGVAVATTLCVGTKEGGANARFTREVGSDSCENSRQKDFAKVTPTEDQGTLTISITN